MSAVLVDEKVPTRLPLDVRPPAGPGRGRDAAGAQRVDTRSAPGLPIRTGTQHGAGRGRSGRGSGPQARPTPSLAGWDGRGGSSGRVRSCAAADGALGPGAIRSGSLATATWHFTDRGIAAILVLAAMILTSALLVVGLTAVHVTGEGYQPISPGQSILAPR